MIKINYKYNSGLESRGLLSSTNIIITSDHGMTTMSPSTRVIYLDGKYTLQNIALMHLHLIHRMYL
jgi:predicted AlkP superfamily pyrophosphatase or phosphodiesterase